MNQGNEGRKLLLTLGAAGFALSPGAVFLWAIENEMEDVGSVAFFLWPFVAGAGLMFVKSVDEG